MEESLLYELIERKYLSDYREKLNNEENDNLSKWLRESREVLEKNFNADQLKLIDRYVYYLDTREDYINFQVDTKLLNYGVKIGMQLQKAFDEEEN